MKAKVLNYSDEWVYLEIQDQLRFQVLYDYSGDRPALKPNQTVNIDFLEKRPPLRVRITELFDGDQPIA